MHFIFRAKNVVHMEVVTSKGNMRSSDGKTSLAKGKYFLNVDHVLSPKGNVPTSKGSAYFQRESAFSDRKAPISKGKYFHQMHHVLSSEVKVPTP